MERSEHEATLNLLGYVPCRMQLTAGSLCLGMTCGLWFIYLGREHLGGERTYRIFISDKQTAIAEQWDVFTDFELMDLCQKARYYEEHPDETWRTGS